MQGRDSWLFISLQNTIGKPFSYILHWFFNFYFLKKQFNPHKTELIYILYCGPFRSRPAIGLKFKIWSSTFWISSPTGLFFTVSPSEGRFISSTLYSDPLLYSSSMPESHRSVWMRCHLFFHVNGWEMFQLYQLSMHLMLHTLFLGWQIALRLQSLPTFTFYLYDVLPQSPCFAEYVRPHHIGPSIPLHGPVENHLACEMYRIVEL